MDILFKKPKLDPINMQSCAPKKKHSPEISCTLYPAAKVPPSRTKIENFNANLQAIYKSYGLSLYMNVNVEDAPTRMGLTPVGGYLSYQLAPTEGNFEVYCNVELSNNCSDSNLLLIYPPFPLSLHCPDFTITQCSKEHQSLLDSLKSVKLKQLLLKGKQFRSTRITDGGMKESIE